LSLSNLNKFDPDELINDDEPPTHSIIEEQPQPFFFGFNNCIIGKELTPADAKQKKDWYSTW
jgi:hypothetical protein